MLFKTKYFNVAIVLYTHIGIFEVIKNNNQENR
jgi:hypothetical protein